MLFITLSWSDLKSSRTFLSLMWNNQELVMYVYSLLTWHSVNSSFRIWRPFRNLMGMGITILKRTYVHFVLCFLMRKALIDSLVHFYKRKVMMITVVKCNGRRNVSHWKIHRIVKVVVASWPWRIFWAICAIELLVLRFPCAIIYPISIRSRTMRNNIIIFNRKFDLCMWIVRSISAKWNTRSHFDLLTLLVFSLDQSSQIRLIGQLINVGSFELIDF